jgi:hypothetical protein
VSRRLAGRSRVEGLWGGGAEGRKRMSREQRKERIIARAMEDFGLWLETL